MTRPRIGDRLVVATHNQGKLEEIGALLAEFGVRLHSNADFGLPEPAETETTFAGNARIKALAAARATGLPALADDSGLCVGALDDAPGVLTADWAEGPDGRNFGRAMARVHQALLATKAQPPWTARFVCALCVAWPDGENSVYQGEVSGQIVWPGRGTAGHGYDPIFQPDGHAVTFGEMDRWKKNRMSHRGRAMQAFVQDQFGDR